MNWVVVKAMFSDGLRIVFSGNETYRRWLLALGAVIAWGAFNYSKQWNNGLIVTGMSDQVSWGFYIANFAFFVGIAAAAVLLVIPAYIFYRKEFKNVVIIGEALAVGAVIVALTFVSVDLGRLDRFIHLLPIIGWYHWPHSILSWDILVLNGYLLLNLGIAFYILYHHYQGKEPDLKSYFVFVVIAMFWAISIHTVTAFVFAGNNGRPFWNSALLAPRFIASAFAAGPALMILALQAIRRYTTYPISDKIIPTLAIIMTVTMQINLFFLGSEVYTHFYQEGEHSASLHYLLFGVDGLNGLRPFIWLAIIFNVTALVLLMVHKTRTNIMTLNIACVLVFAGIWLEKGMGLVVPGFIPTQLGEFFEYTPTFTEVSIAMGVWALGAFVFTVLVRVALAIEQGHIGQHQPTELEVDEEVESSRVGPWWVRRRYALLARR